MVRIPTPEEKERLNAFMERHAERQEIRKRLPQSSGGLESYIEALNLCVTALFEIEHVVEELRMDIQALKTRLRQDMADGN